jgi:3-isopropylmalate/(R)-2-methylmalate dehydratase large subunit
MGTIIEEILSRKLGRPVKAGEIVLAEVDYMMSHDNTTPLAIKAWKDIGKPIKDKDRIVIHFDHAYPAPNLLAAEAQKKIVDFMKEQGIKNFYHQGICHQVMTEEGFVTPGKIIIGGDSHSNTYGAFGAFGVGFGSTEIGCAWVTGKTWFRVPETIHIILKGKNAKGAYAKDVMIYIAGLLGMDGATYKSVEFSGEYIERLPMHERIIFPNMTTEIGAKCGFIAVDDTTIDFLKTQTNAKGPFEKIVPVHPKYEKTIEIDVDEIAPYVACHPDVDHAKPLQEVEGLPIDEVFLGTCTNGRYEDIEIFANILRGKKVSRFTRTLVNPASKNILQKAIDNGLIKVLQDAGVTIGVVGCGACIGRHAGILGPGERAFTTMNRNFVGRMGSPQSEIYLGSPAAAAATAIEGKIADPRRYI